ncbi:MAG: hypothetical protein II183_02900, partial [Elusimicrobiaceae bacterium]|nr:hypothetical protein [Elusimicrobiaceae bacterium]
IEVGEVAVFFRELSKKYNTDNYAQIMLTPEATSYIRNEYIKDAENIAKFVMGDQEKNLNSISSEQLREYGKEIIKDILTGKLK